MNCSGNKFIRFDMGLIRELYNFFFTEDDIPYICRNVLYNFIFKGDIDIVLEDTKNQDISPEEKRDLVKAFKAAMDYFFLIGLVPFRIVMSHYGKLIPVIPQFGSGLFYHYYDCETLESEVVFILNRAPIPVYDRDIRLRVIEDGFHVFVWPGHEPNYFEQMFDSLIYKIYIYYLDKCRLWTNFLSADFNRTNPPIITTTKLQDKPVSEVAQEFAIDPNPISLAMAIDPRDVDRERRESQRKNKITSLANDRKRLSMGIIEHREYSKEDEALINKQQQRFFYGGVFNLPEGETIETTPIPDSTKLIMQILKDYEDKVCSVMGIPRDAIFSTGQSKYNAFTVNVMSLQIFKSSIADKRESISLFYAYAYKCSYLPIDIQSLKEDIKARTERAYNELPPVNSKEAEKMTAVKKKKGKGKKGEKKGETPSSPEKPKPTKPSDIAIGEGTPVEYQGFKGSRALIQNNNEQVNYEEMILEARKNILEKLETETYEISVVFREDPFLELSEKEDILTYMEKSIILDEEGIYLLRKKIGLPTDDKTLRKLAQEKERKKKEKEKEKEKEMKMSLQLKQANKPPATSKPPSEKKKGDDKFDDKEGGGGTKKVAKTEKADAP